jgi:hypothetical protein
MQCGVARREATECHIYNVALNIFVLIESKLLLLFRTSNVLERRAHCWFAAERAASLADAAPPCGVRADTV